MEPNKYEIEVLEMLADQRPKQSGSWINACLEFLSEMGLVTRTMPFRITEKGREFLANRK